MKASACPRLFEVEALRNGRLTGAERTRFERHLTTCAACAHEAEELEALGQAVRASHPASTDELHLRRERTRLLAAFDRALVVREGPWAARRRLLALAGAAALAAGLVAFWRTRPAPAPAQATNAVIRADHAALWSRRTQENREKLVLERGELWIQVTHVSRASPLLVMLPDGELEDTGTTFSVTVEAGHTARVAVEEGSVMLRLRGQAPFAIGAGEAWTAALPPSTSASAAPRVEPAPLVEPSPSAAQVRPSSPSARSTSPSPSVQRRDASDDFRAAVAALHHGENREAAARLARFLEQYPRDSRSEDAAYLRVLALRRSGDDSAMKAAAFEYLSRYPAGFRRSEVETLTR